MLSLKTHPLLPLFLFHYYYYVGCHPDVGIGYQVTLAIPPAYTPGFVGRAFLMESDLENSTEPNFRTALTVQAPQQQDDDQDQYYSCSLDILLANVKVWSSAHFSHFYTADNCTLHFTPLGDLQLKGQDDRIGWRSGTSGQGVQRLHLLRSGNLVLVDSLNSIKWQSFNFPTDIMLWGQRLSSKTRLTSFLSTSSSSNSTTPFYYTFEVQYDKIALFLNSGKFKYSYWEFRPPVGEHNITYIELTSNALQIYNGNFQKVAEIPASPQQQQEQEKEAPLRFLALENATGNLGLYFYSSRTSGFQAAYQALNSSCDLPLACDPYGICTFSQTCSCISLVTRGGAAAIAAASGAGRGGRRNSGGCGSSISGSSLPCGSSSGNEGAEMVELRGVTSVLRGMDVEVNVSKESCEELCLNNCTCVAALYTTWSSETERECLLYGLVRGIKQVDVRSRNTAMVGSTSYYMVKVAKGMMRNGERVEERNSGLKRWVVIVIGVGDGFLITVVVVGGIGYYLIRNRKRRDTNNTS